MAANPNEIAVLVVNGQKFQDWKTVSVQQYLNSSDHIFTFTCSEAKRIPPSWTLLQFKPGDICQIYLAGILAMDGYIVTRQVAYDATNHGVQLIGRSKTWDVARSSVKTTDGKFDGYSFSAIARSVLAPFGVSLETRGQIDDTPFDQCQVHPGETCWEFLERLARPRSIVLGSTERGNLIAIGDHQATAIDALVEGINIRNAKCVVTDQYIHFEYLVPGQMSGSDAAWGRAVSEMMARTPGTANRYSPLIIPTEQPGTMMELQKRAEFEAAWRQGTLIDAEITVQGWLRANADLWRIGSYVRVTSEMLMLDQTLGIQTATFNQSENGTETVLNLVAPEFLNGHADLSAALAAPGLATPVP